MVYWLDYPAGGPGAQQSSSQQSSSPPATTGAAQQPQVVRDEVLGAAGDPGQVAHAQLSTLAQRRSQHQPRRVRERPRPLGSPPGSLDAKQSLPDLLSPRSIDTQQITPFFHTIILICVDTLVQGERGAGSPPL
jgi:hypothetical protein